jgi:hypothetical protein
MITGAGGSRLPTRFAAINEAFLLLFVLGMNGAFFSFKIIEGNTFSPPPSPPPFCFFGNTERVDPIARPWRMASCSLKKKNCLLGNTLANRISADVS